jgi:predicted RNA methylase
MLAVSFWTVWTGRALRSLRKRGLLGSITFAAALAKRDISARWINFPYENQLCRYLDTRFDRRFAVDTASIVKLRELQTDARFKYANKYAPTPRFLFSRALRQVRVDHNKFVFIDFGCGKGKALLLASELPFKRIIGIELSSELIRVAEDNLRSYLGRRGKCDRVQLACMDASEFQIPGEPAIYYFCNPFGTVVMRKILENIRLSLAAVPREVFVVYLNPELQSLFDESGFLTPIKRTSWYSIHKASGI